MEQWARLGKWSIANRESIGRPSELVRQLLRPQAGLRPFVVLLPVLALFVTATYVLSPRPDDEAAYLALAERLTQGYYTTGDDDALVDAEPASPDLWFGPGLPVALAPLVALDVPLPLIRATGPVFLFAAVVCFYLLARLAVCERAALAATWGLALYWPAWTLLPNVHSEPLAILLLVAGVYLLALGLRSTRLVPLLGAGAAFAGLALTRVAFGWIVTAVLVGLLACWATTRAAVFRRSALAFAVALLLCVPWLAYTYGEAGRPFVWGNSGSLSLYWMSSPHPRDLGDWHQADDVFTDPRLAPHRPFFEGLRGTSLAHQVHAIEQRALDQILEHPGAYAGNIAANVSRLLFNTPYSFQPQTSRILFYALPNALLVGAVFLSLVLGVVSGRTRGVAAPPELAAIALLAVATLGLHVLVAAYPRMLVPAVPLLLWVAVVALRRASVVGPPSVEAGWEVGRGRIAR